MILDDVMVSEVKLDVKVVMQRLQEVGLECLSVYEPEIQEISSTRTYLKLAGDLSLKVIEKPFKTQFSVILRSKDYQTRTLLWHPCEDKLAFGVSNVLDGGKAVYDEEIDSLDELLTVLKRMYYNEFDISRLS